MTRFATPRAWHIELMLGNIPDMEELEKFGHNPLINTATTPEDIWDRGGVHVPPTTAQTIRVHGDVNDIAVTGTGARTVRVTGHNASGVEVEEDFAMNGVTPVVSTSTWTAVYRMRVLTAGALEANSGAILCIAVTDVTVQCQISADEGQSLMAIYKVPTGKELIIEEWGAGLNRTGGAATEAKLRLQVKPSGGAWNTKAFEGVMSVGTSKFTENLYVSAPALSWVRIQCVSVSSNNADVSAAFEGPLVTVT